jgi:hypothetical protein
VIDPDSIYLPDPTEAEAGWGTEESSFTVDSIDRASVEFGTYYNRYSSTGGGGPVDCSFSVACIPSADTNSILTFTPDVPGYWKVTLHGHLVVLATGTGRYETDTVPLVCEVTCYNFRIKMVPTDNFADRSNDRLGLKETGHFEAEPFPGRPPIPGYLGIPGTTLAALAPMIFMNETDIDVSNFNSTAVTEDFAAGGEPVVAKVTLADKDANRVTLSIPIIAPSGISWELDTNGGVYHLKNCLSIGARGRMYVLPDDVSFHNIVWAEGDAAADRQGWFTRCNPILHDRTPTWISTYGGLSGKGSILANDDTIGWGTLSKDQQGVQPFELGTATTAIPQFYSTTAVPGAVFDGFSGVHAFDVDMIVTVTANGTTKIKKGNGTEVSAAIGADTTGYNTIAGRVTHGGVGVAGVRITLVSSFGDPVPAPVTTDNLGYYKFSAVISGNYTITPSDDGGSTFTPAQLTTQVQGMPTVDAGGQDFSK